MTSAQVWTSLLLGTLLTAAGTGTKFLWDAATGRRARRLTDDEAALRLAEMVKRVATDEVETLTERLAELDEHRGRADQRIEALRREVHALKLERDSHRAEIEQAQTEIAGLQRRITGVIDDRDDLARVLVMFRAWIAAGAKPPAPVIPEHLADVLPRWLPVDGPLPNRVRPDGID